MLRDNGIPIRVLRDESRRKMGDARRGCKASPETRAKLKVTNSRKRGPYHETWAEIVTLCNQRKWTFKRVRNYWQIFDEFDRRHSFLTAKAAIAFLKGKYDYEEYIQELCVETGYIVKHAGISYFIDDEWGKRITKYNDPINVVRFLERMKSWLKARNMLKPLPKQTPRVQAPPQRRESI